MNWARECFFTWIHMATTTESSWTLKHPLNSGTRKHMGPTTCGSLVVQLSHNIIWGSWMAQFNISQVMILCWTYVQYIKSCERPREVFMSRDVTSPTHGVFLIDIVTKHQFLKPEGLDSLTHLRWSSFASEKVLANQQFQGTSSNFWANLKWIVFFSPVENQVEDRESMIPTPFLHENLPNEQSSKSPVYKKELVA